MPKLRYNRIEFEVSHGKQVELVTDPALLAGGGISHAVVCMFLQSCSLLLVTLDIISLNPQKRLS